MEKKCDWCGYEFTDKKIMINVYESTDQIVDNFIESLNIELQSEIKNWYKTEFRYLQIYYKEIQDGQFRKMKYYYFHTNTRNSISDYIGYDYWGFYDREYLPGNIKSILEL